VIGILARALTSEFAQSRPEAKIFVTRYGLAFVYLIARRLADSLALLVRRAAADALSRL
jgi:hypothetical protein